MPVEAMSEMQRQLHATKRMSHTVWNEMRACEGSILPENAVLVSNLSPVKVTLRRIVKGTTLC